jgi:2-dehydropantoate 2-reductase
MPTAAVTVLGTGALASLTGARLARAGYAVTLLGTWRAAIDAVNARGITVEDESGQWSAPACALLRGSRVEPAALVIVLVKSAQTVAVSGAAASAAPGDGLVLTLQNGLGNCELLAVAAGAQRVGTGVAFLGAASVAPGVVRDGGGKRVVLGNHRRIDLAMGPLAAAGFAVETVADIAPVQWLKLAANCAINPLSALCGVPNGALLGGSEARATLEAAAREVGAVASALGIRLARDPAEVAVEVAQATPRNRSSMLQDVERRVVTEIESLNGAVVREAERLGVDVPVNRRLLEAIRALTVTGRSGQRARRSPDVKAAQHSSDRESQS